MEGPHTLSTSHLHAQSFRQTDIGLLETEEKIKLNPNVLFDLENISL